MSPVLELIVQLFVVYRRTWKLSLLKHVLIRLLNQLSVCVLLCRHSQCTSAPWLSLRQSINLALRVGLYFVKTQPPWREVSRHDLSSVSLDDISAVRVGRQSEGLKKNTEEQVESRCFTIMFKGRRKNLDLIASSEEEARRWVSSLQKLVSTMNSLNQMQKTEQYPLLKINVYIHKLINKLITFRRSVCVDLCLGRKSCSLTPVLPQPWSHGWKSLLNKDRFFFLASRTSQLVIHLLEEGGQGQRRQAEPVGNEELHAHDQHWDGWHLHRDALSGDTRTPPGPSRLPDQQCLLRPDRFSPDTLFKQKCDESKSGFLSGKEIEHFYDLLTHRQEIDVIYGEYAKTTGFMSGENLVEFLMKEQREKASLVNALKIIEDCEPDENGQSCLRSGSWFHLVYLSQDDGQHHGNMGWENLGYVLLFRPPRHNSTLPVSAVYVCSTHPLCVKQIDIMR